MRGEITKGLDLAACAMATAWPRRRVGRSTGLQHVPFGMFLVGLLRPTTLVELGTGDGDSYCAFCQAVESLGLDTRCHAILAEARQGHDEGDDGLHAHHDPRYGGFSRLLAAPHGAVAHFADATVDLLHITGHRSDEALRDAFTAWLPKVSPHGVVLVHGIGATGDGGARRAWAEISRHAEHFEFLHGDGLGVVAAGKPPAALVDVFSATGRDAAAIRQLFHALGHRLGAASPDTVVGRALMETLEHDLADAREQRDTNAKLLARSLDFVAHVDHERHAQVQETARVQGDLAAREGELAARTGELAQRREELAQLREELARLQKVLTVKDAELVAWTRHGESARHDVAAVRHALAERDGELAARAREVENLRETVADLRGVTDFIFRSRSWRLTELLRRLGRRVHGGR